MSVVRYFELVRGYVSSLCVSYRLCAADRVRLAVKPNFEFASRCRLVRSNSSFGCSTRGLFSTRTILASAAARTVAAIVSASSPVAVLFSAPRCQRPAYGLPDWLVKSATISQYGTGMKALISSSRRAISASVGVLTRPIGIGLRGEPTLTVAARVAL